MITPTEWTRFKFEWPEQVMYTPDLTPAAKVVAFCIIQHCNMSSECGWPSLKRTATLTKLRKATVIEAVALLEGEGYLTKTPGTAGHPGRGQSNVYTPTLKGTPTVPLEDAERIRSPDPSADETFQERVRFSEKKGTVFDQKGTVKGRKGTETGPEHFREHLHRTPSLNTVRPSAAPADKEIQQAKKKVEQDLSDWKAKGLIDEQMANKTSSVITDLLDGYAAGEATREEVETAYGKIRDAVLKRPPKQQPPSGGSADCSAEVSEPIVLSTPPAPPQMPARGSPEDAQPIVLPTAATPPERLTTATVITLAMPRTVPKPPTPSAPRKPKLAPEEQDRRAKLKVVVTNLWAAGKLTDAEATRRLDEIDAAPREACAVV